MTKLDADLQKYAFEKFTNACKDVMQAFEIAEQSRYSSISLIACTMLRLSAGIAAEVELTKSQWLELCAELYTQQKKEAANG